MITTELAAWPAIFGGAILCRFFLYWWDSYRPKWTTRRKLIEATTILLGVGCLVASGVILGVAGLTNEAISLPISSFGIAAAAALMGTSIRILYHQR